MNKLLDAIDKYKYGLIAALATYVLIFMYLQMESYTEYTKIEPFHDGSSIEIPKEEVKVLAENIEVPADYDPNVKNITRDVNDERERSYEDYSTSNRSVKDVEAQYKEIEQKMFEEAGGAKTREQIRKEMENRKLVQSTNEGPSNVSKTSTSSEKVYKGNVMVDWSLPSRTPHLNNDWYVRNPGYTCGYGSGVIVVDIKVDPSGNVVSAVHNTAKSKGGNSCMIEQSLKYAKMSRFNYSGSSEKFQSGWIQYIFVSQ